MQQVVVSAVVGNSVDGHAVLFTCIEGSRGIIFMCCLKNRQCISIRVDGEWLKLLADRIKVIILKIIRNFKGHCVVRVIGSLDRVRSK